MPFEEAVDEIIIGKAVYDDDKYKMAMYAIVHYRILKTHLPEEKHGPMNELICSFLQGKLDSDAFRQKAKELRDA